MRTIPTVDKSNRSVHLVFAVALAALGATAGASMYLNRDQPALNETPPSASESAAGLPASHPPVDFAERIAVLERQSRTDPSNPDYRIQMGNLYYDSGQYGKAREAYEAGLRLRPGDPGIETDLATCYHYLGQHEKALELLDRVLESHPNFSQALFNKGYR